MREVLLLTIGILSGIICYLITEIIRDFRAELAFKKKVEEALEKDDSPHSRLWRYERDNGPLFQNIEDAEKFEMEKKLLKEVIPEITVEKKTKW